VPWVGIYSGSRPAGSIWSKRFKTNCDSNAQLVKTVTSTSLVVLSKLGAMISATTLVFFFLSRRCTLTKITSRHFGHLHHARPEEQLNERDDKEQYSAIEDR
jgi:hypothetical protein